MKKYTHPTLNYTRLRHKDGSTQGIYWIYSRPTLLLEANSKKMSDFVSTSNYTVYHKQIGYTKKDTTPFWNTK